MFEFICLPFGLSISPIKFIESKTDYFFIDLNVFDNKTASPEIKGLAFAIPV